MHSFSFLWSLRIRLMCIFVIKFKFSFFQNKLFDSTQLIVINLINSSSENLMDYIHNASVKKKYDFPHLIQGKLLHLQIGWLEKEKDVTLFLMMPYMYLYFSII